MGENSWKGKRSIDKRKIKSSCRVTIFEKILLEINNFSQLCTYVSCAQRNLTKFSNVFFQESIDLVSSNLFRALPHSSTNAAAAIRFEESYYINGETESTISLSKIPIGIIWN
ncbi:hypothetical protein QUC31_010375 [Theobroma cacao]